MSSAKNFSLKEAEEKLVTAFLKDSESAGNLAKKLLLEEMARRESEKKKTGVTEAPSTGTPPE